MGALCRPITMQAFKKRLHLIRHFSVGLNLKIIVKYLTILQNRDIKALAGASCQDFALPYLHKQQNF